MFSIFDAAPFIGYTITQKLLVYAIAGGVFLSFVAYWFVQTFNGGLVRKLLERGVGKENGATLKELGKNRFLYRWLLRNGSTLRNLISCDCGELAEIKKIRGDEATKTEQAESAEEAEDAEKAEQVAEDNAEKSIIEESNAKESDGSGAEPEKKEKPSFKDRLKAFFRGFRIKRYNYDGVKFFISEENKRKAKDRHSKPVNPLWLPLVLVLCALCAFGMTYLLPIIMDFIRN